MNRAFHTARGTIVIRQSNLADVASFRELRLEALQDSPTAFSMDYQRSSHYPLKYWEDTLVMDDMESAIFFAEQEGHLIGMTGIARGRSPKTKHAADVWGVYVTSQWRGLHVAEELIRSCREWAQARQIVILRLAVVAANTSAVRCYERCGFLIYGTEPRSLLYEGKYYDEYLMSLSLDG
ncbi:MAG: N-acetyltransferase family protein [Byssovorax cruenta]